MNRPASPSRLRPVWFFAAGIAVAWLPAWAPLLRPTASQQQQAPSRALSPSSGNADSNNRMIAVTGTDITGASILYLVDTENEQLAIYQANAGTGASQGVRFVGARRIALDLQLDGFNDRSDYTFKDLRKRFDDQGLIPGSSGAAPGPEGAGADR